MSARCRRAAMLLLTFVPPRFRTSQARAVLQACSWDVPTALNHYFEAGMASCVSREQALLHVSAHAVSDDRAAAQPVQVDTAKINRIFDRYKGTLLLGRGLSRARH